ncbi:MAG: Uma2 family endonuclease [Planctomycetes bacterium]|nr:Uma2 family endonuclease [Planctomycetota bacterium]
MASETVSHDIPEVPSSQLLPSIEHLVTEDDTPVDNIFSEKQQRLLTEPLYSSWRPAGEQGKFVALANVGLYYAVNKPPYVPDMLLSLDVELPAELWPKANRSYFVWEYGKLPDVVVEVVSNREGREDSEKLDGYAHIGVPYYVIFDPERLLSDQPVRAYRREARTYCGMDEPFWLAGVELGLCLWQGSFEQHEDTWLRWMDAEGHAIPTGAERAEQERQRADQLAEQLRQLGVEPEV